MSDRHRIDRTSRVHRDAAFQPSPLTRVQGSWDELRLIILVTNSDESVVPHGVSHAEVTNAREFQLYVPNQLAGKEATEIRTGRWVHHTIFDLFFRRSPSTSKELASRSVTGISDPARALMPVT